MEPKGLKLYAYKSGVNQGEIARFIGKSRQTVNTLLNGEWAAIDTLVSLLLAIGLTMETIKDIPLGDLFELDEVTQ